MMAGNQELTVLSQTDLTCIEGLSLHVALKAAKSQVTNDFFQRFLLHFMFFYKNLQFPLCFM